MFNRLLLIAAVAVMGFGGYFIKTAFDKVAIEATLKCQLDHKNQSIKADKEAAMDKDEIVNEEQKLKDAEILDALIAIGIVRADNDR
jgi:hypothetical protein